MTEYEQRFSKLMKLVPTIQENEEHKCKRFMAALNVRIKVHLAWASQNNFRELVEAALKVERTVSVLTRGGQTVREVLPALVSQAPVSQALVSLVERKERNRPAVEAQDEEQHLARDQSGRQQP